MNRNAIRNGMGRRAHFLLFLLKGLGEGGRAGFGVQPHRRKEKAPGGPELRRPRAALYHLASKMLVTLERMPLGLSLAARSS